MMRLPHRSILISLNLYYKCMNFKHETIFFYTYNLYELFFEFQTIVIFVNLIAL